MKRPAKVVEVRPSRLDEFGLESTGPAWVAVDSDGRKFGGDDAAEARLAAERYNAGQARLYLRVEGLWKETSE